MAEIGIVASSIRIAKTALKLKRLWSEIRDGPKEVEELVQETVVQAAALGDLRDFHQSTNNINMNGSGWEKCYLLFKTSAEALENVVKDLQSMLTKHKRTGSMRLYLKKDDLIRCKERFQRVQMTMLSSQQAYFALFAAQNFSMIMSEIRAIPQQQQKQLVSPVVDRTSPESSRNHDMKAGNSSVQLDNSSRPVPSNNSMFYKDKLSYHTTYQLQLPRWILRKALQVAVQRSNASWGVTFRTYNRISSGSPVILAAERSDWATVRRLFDLRQASPFDVDPDGYTLLLPAIVRFEYDACRMLLNYGLRSAGPPDLECAGNYFDILDLIVEYDFDISPSAIERADRLISLIDDDDLRAAFRLPDVGYLEYFFKFYPTPLLSTVIRAGYPEYNMTDPLFRVKNALTYLPSDENRLQILLGPDLDLVHAFELAKEFNLDSNHIDTLRNLSRIFGDGVDETQCHGSWLRALRQVVAFESENVMIHAYQSTLAKFLCHYYSHCTFSQIQNYGNTLSNERFTEAARIWIRILHEAGANLVNFFAAEKMYFSKNKRVYIGISLGFGPLIEFRIVSITGGANVEDWNLYIVPGQNEEYEMAGAFWNWVENPELFNIPGSYLDNDDYDTDYGTDDEDYEGEYYDRVSIQGPIL